MDDEPKPAELPAVEALRLEEELRVWRKLGAQVANWLCWSRPPEPVQLLAEVSSICASFRTGLSAEREKLRLRCWLESIRYDIPCFELREAAQAALDGKPAPAPHPLRSGR